MRVQRDGRHVTVDVVADGEGVVSHAGAALLAEAADRFGLTAAWSDALAGVRERRGRHDPGRVIRDLAVMVADGGDCLADLRAVRDQEPLFGAVGPGPRHWPPRSPAWPHFRHPRTEPGAPSPADHHPTRTDRRPGHDPGTRSTPATTSSTATQAPATNRPARLPTHISLNPARTSTTRDQSRPSCTIRARAREFER